MISGLGSADAGKSAMAVQRNIIRIAKYVASRRYRSLTLTANLIF
jgi:hypothetical protein